jgi:mycothiol synthase
MMPAPTMTLTAFDSATADEQLWDWIVEFQLSNFKENNPNDPAPPPEFIRQQLVGILDSPHHDIRIFVATHEATLYGAYAMLTHREDSPEYEDNKHVILGTLWVAPEFRRQGIGAHLLEHLITSAQERDLTLLQLESGTDAGHAFAERYMGKVAILSNASRLYTEDIDWDKMQAWYDTCQANLPDVTLERFEGLIGDDDIEAYAEFYTEVLNQQPLEDTQGLETTFTPDVMRKEHETMTERGMRHVTFITREADGTISGMTEIFHHPQRAHSTQQGLTGVQEAYRGRGLGKYLKSAMVLFARGEFPEQQFIATNNASVNEPMLAINIAMGFKLHRQSRIYKFDVAEVTEQFA